MRPLAADLERQRARGLYRGRQRLDGPQGVDVRIDGQRCIAFCSNDYLGLAGHPRVVDALRDGAARYGAGSGASHLVSGHGGAHDALEEALAGFTGRPRALLFSTGYMANLGVLSALAGRGDRIHADRLCHASLLDGARLSGARLRRYRHCDSAHLAARLGAEGTNDSGDGRRFIVTDGVFSMDGDLAPLPELAALAARHDAWLVVDDAHGLGVIGAGGGGSLAHFGLSAVDAPILVGTLGKAFGTFGAFVAGSEELIESLIQFARSYLYTTALPPAIACATLEALRIAREEPWRRERLADLSRRFAEGAVALGLRLEDPGSGARPGAGSDPGSDRAPQGLALPIVPILVGDAQRAVALSRALFERGLLVTAIRPPTVPEGGARLRVTLSAAHTPEQVDRLLETLGELW